VEGNYRTRTEKPPDSQTQHTFCNSIYTFYLSSISFHITSMHVPNGPVGTDEFLRLSVGRLWRHKFVQQQVELQIHSNDILAISREAVPLNCSNQTAQTKWLETVTATLSCFIALLVKTQMNLMFKNKL